MIQRRDCLRLALEAGQPTGVGSHGGGEDLESHRPSELRVLCEVDLTHAALADLADDTVVFDRLTGSERHGRPRRRETFYSITWSGRITGRGVSGARVLGG